MTKLTKWVCAPSKDSDQPGNPPSLIRVFAVRMKLPIEHTVSSVNSLPSEIQSSATPEVTPVSETGLNECSETAPSGSVIQSESVHITVMILCFRRP